MGGGPGVDREMRSDPTHRDDFDGRQAGRDIASDRFLALMERKGFECVPVGPDAKDLRIPRFWLWPLSLWIPDFWIVRGERALFVEVKGTAKIKRIDIEAWMNFRDRLTEAGDPCEFLIAIIRNPTLPEARFRFYTLPEIRSRWMNAPARHYPGETDRFGRPKEFRIV